MGDDYSPSGAEGAFVDTVLDGASQWYVAKVIERTKDGRLKSAQAGNVLVASKPPYGYDKTEVDGKHQLKINDREASIVKRTFREFLSGESMTGLAKKYTAEGIQKKNPESGPVWGSKQIRDILRKETYTGVWHYGKTRTVHKGGVRNREPVPRSKWVEIEVPEIITKDAWEEVQLILDANLRTHSGHIKHEYLLRGRVFCTECNIRYYNQTVKQKYGYYIHDEYNRHITECTSKKRISVSKFDNAVQDFVIELISDPEFAEGERLRMEQDKDALDGPLQDELEQLDVELGELSERLKRARYALTEGAFDLDEFIEQKVDIELREQQILNRIEDIRKELQPIQRRVMTEEDIGSELDEHLWYTPDEPLPDHLLEEVLDVIKSNIDWGVMIERLDVKGYVAPSGKVTITTVYNGEEVISKDGIGWKHIV